MIAQGTITIALCLLSVDLTLW